MEVGDKDSKTGNKNRQIFDGESEQFDNDDFSFVYTENSDQSKTRARRIALSTAIIVLVLGLSGYLYTNFAGASSSIPSRVIATAPLPSINNVALTNNDAAINSLNSLSPASGTPAPASNTPAPANAAIVTPPPAMASTADTSTNPAAVVEIPPGQAPAMPAALTPEPPANNSIPNIGGAANTQTPAPVSRAANPTAAPAAISAGVVSGTAAAPVNPAANAGPAAPDVYYDAGGASAGADNAMAIGPRKVDPAQEPASKFIIVNKDEGPQGINAQVVAADRALKLGHYDAASDMFDALYAKNPRDPRILMGRAVAYQNSGRTETAMKMYDELLDIDPDNANALVNMLGLLRKQYPEVALRRLINLHDKYPNNATIAAQIGVTESDQNQFDDAIRYLTMAVSMEPNNAQHQFNLAVTVDRAGHKTDAVKYYQQALETDAVYGNGRSIPREKIYDRLAALRQQTSGVAETPVSSPVQQPSSPTLPPS